jgi:hypothetical protein
MFLYSVLNDLQITRLMFNAPFSAFLSNRFILVKEFAFRTLEKF